MASTTSRPSQPYNTERDIENLFGPIEDRSPTVRCVRTPRLGFSSSLAFAAPPCDRLALDLLIEHTTPAVYNYPDSKGDFLTVQPSISGLDQWQTMDRPSQQGALPSPFHTASFSYPTIPGPQNTVRIDHNGMNMASPLQTSFDASPSSYNSGPSAFQDSEPPSAISSRSSFVSIEPPADSPSLKRDIDEADIKADSVHTITMDVKPARRRRSSATVETHSTRVLYLEKNRKAASKCRTKQKKQQEDLVETAREAERKNKILKAEVELLKDDMRGLMQMIFEHGHCPDNRMQTYVQREADKLTARASKVGVQGSRRDG